MWDVIYVVTNFLIELYNAGGSKLRWVVWAWVAFSFLYFILGQYDKKHNINKTINERTHVKKNYFYSLHVFGLLSIFCVYSSLLYNLPLAPPMTVQKNTTAALSLIGFVLLGAGLVIVLIGRMDLDGYWGCDIYDYPDECNVLVQKGIYSKMRHPIYFGQSLMTFGSAFVVNNLIVLLLSFALLGMNISRALREDRHLKEKHPVEWPKYKEKASFFFPFF